MKIVQSQVQLSGQQQSLLSAQLTGLAARIVAADESGTSGADMEAGIQLSLSRRSEEKQQLSHSSVISGGDGEQRSSSSSFLASRLLESVTSVNYQVYAVHPPGDSAGLGVQVEVQSILQLKESSTLNFEALGQVLTEDGRQIDFMLALEFSRHTEIEQANLFQGRLNLIDPLMINLSGGAVELSDQYFYFDLDGDGQTERIVRTATGSGYLVFDRNSNGTIDDGSELFGPQSGNGFAELTQYDDDGNGWIDENDAIFSQLGVMQFDEQGAVTRSASETGLGALYLGSVASDYQLTNEQGAVQGVIKGSGVALSEAGTTLLLQEVHLNPLAFPPPGAYFRATDPVMSASGDVDIRSPLGFFQFDDALLNSRDEHTLVGMRQDINDNPNLVATGVLNNGEHPSLNTSPFSQNQRPAGNNPSSAQQSTAVHSAATDLSNLRAPQPLDVQQWISSAMRNFDPQDDYRRAASSAPVFNPIPDPVRATPLNLQDEIGVIGKETDSRLRDLRATIEELKALRRQQQENSRQTALYQAIRHLQE